MCPLNFRALMLPELLMPGIINMYNIFTVQLFNAVLVDHICTLSGSEVITSTKNVREPPPPLTNCNRAYYLGFFLIIKSLNLPSRPLDTA